MKTAPLCRYCGGPIAKKTVSHFIETDPRYVHHPHQHLVNKGEEPRTKADCQRMVNQKVVSVRRSHEGTYIRYFSTWDGESYIDPFFCNGEHARLFGYSAARAGKATKSYNDAMEGK